jgi:hypothetical protein
MRVPGCCLQDTEARLHSVIGFEAFGDQSWQEDSAFAKVLNNF